MNCSKYDYRIDPPIQLFPTVRADKLSIKLDRCEKS